MSGIIFHIDDNAYEQLNTYLNTIRGYFKNTEGGDEIMADIEARIAEMFQQRVGNTKQVILIKDVEEIIAVMGKPESYILDDDSPNNDQQKHAEPKYTEERIKNKNRRVFRDGDDKVLGGVCSGIASYFNVDPLWVRIAFAIAFFGFGSGFLIYVLLWIIIPEAKTTTEKLEMRGENVNISNIEKTIRDEMDDLKNRYDKDGHLQQNLRSSVQKVVDFVLMILTFLAKAFLKILGGFLIFIGVIFLIGLTGMFFGSDAIINITSEGVSEISMHYIFNTFFNSGSEIIQAKIGLGLLVLIPVLMVIYSGVKIVFKLKQKNRLLKGIALGLWTIGLVLSIMTVYSVSKEFSQKAIEKNYTTLPINANYVTLSGTIPFDKFEEQDNEINGIRLGEWKVISQTDEKLNFGYAKVDIVKSETDSFVIIVQRIAQGKTKKEASGRAQSISYNYNVTDSAIMFAPDFSISSNQKWRDQRVKVILKVPVGKTIFLDRSLKRTIYDIDNVTNTRDKDMLSRRWLMTAQGLKCVDCDGLDKDDEEDFEEEIEEAVSHAHPVPPVPPVKPNHKKHKHKY